VPQGVRCSEGGVQGAVQAMLARKVMQQPALGQAHTAPGAAGHGSALGGALRGGGGGGEEDEVSSSGGTSVIRNRVEHSREDA